MGAVAAALVHAVRGLAGLPAARQLYRALLRVPPAGGDFFHAVLDLELAEEAAAGAAHAARGAAASSAALPAARLRELFDAAVDAYGALDTRLWLLYVAFEEEQQRRRPGSGDPGKVQWRAVRALRQPSEFEAAYQQRFTLQL